MALIDPEARRKYNQQYYQLNKERLRRPEVRTKQAEWYENNKERASLNAKQWRYGVTPAWMTETLAAQGGACAICRKVLTGATHNLRPHVDHDHETNVVRGVLCQGCNVALGRFEDCIETLEAAIFYLKTHARTNG